MRILDTIFGEVLLFKRGYRQDRRGTSAVIGTDGLPSDFKICEQRAYTIPKAGAFYGIHYDDASRPRAKLITVIRGAGDDYIIDLRKDSDTYLKWERVRLSGENALCIYIPMGFGHGFLSVCDDTIQLFSADRSGADCRTMRISCYDETIGLGLPDGVILSDEDMTAPPICQI